MREIFKLPQKKLANWKNKQVFITPQEAKTTFSCAPQNTCVQLPCWIEMCEILLVSRAGWEWARELATGFAPTATSGVDIDRKE